MSVFITMWDGSLVFFFESLHTQIDIFHAESEYSGKKKIFTCACRSISGVSRVTSAVVRTHSVVTISVDITVIAVVWTLVNVYTEIKAWGVVSLGRGKT